MANPTIVTAAASYPVLLSDAKEHIRVSITDDDLRIDGMIGAATRHCEQIARKSFVTQTLAVTLDDWPNELGFYLKRPPIASVTSITYTDEDGDSDTVSSDDYIVDTANGRIALKAASTWPNVTLQRIAGVVIQYVAGYGDRNDVPDEVKQAILLVVGDWYENRENMLVGVTSKTIDYSVRDLLGVDRNYLWGSVG